MSVWYFSCKNCGDAASEYNEIHCEACEVTLCDCVMPKEIKDLCNVWDNLYEYVTSDKDNNIIGKEGTDKATVEVFRKYLSCNDDYGIVLKEEYCPICQKRLKNEQDPEYKEYLRLKEKFEN